MDGVGAMVDVLLVVCSGRLRCDCAPRRVVRCCSMSMKILVSLSRNCSMLSFWCPDVCQEGAVFDRR